MVRCHRVEIWYCGGGRANGYAGAVAGDGLVLMGGDGGIYIGSYDINLEMLKQHLPEIAKKGEA